uniref:Putative calcium-transporting ATPase 5, plasma membrane-type n=1 Tax=Lygus hesperus TaxID=30085 RepID=A0A0A9YRA7_LYGHE
MIVTTVNAVNDYHKQEQFAQVMRSEDATRRLVTMFRCHGMHHDICHAQQIPSSELVVGDIVEVRAGMQLSVDALLLHSYGDIITDESAVTGENDEVCKRVLPHGVTSDPLSEGMGDVFLISGSSILDGSAEGLAVVCAVGPHSFAGEIAMTIQDSEKVNTPLQDQLEHMATVIGKLGTAAACVTFVALLLKEL